MHTPTSCRAALVEYLRDTYGCDEAESRVTPWNRWQADHDGRTFRLTTKPEGATVRRSYRGGWVLVEL